MRCSGCNEEIFEGQNFCKFCGTVVLVNSNTFEIIECGNCKEKILSKYKFCKFCGSRTRKIFCTECGDELESRQRFCKNCGAVVEDDIDLAQYEKMQNSRLYHNMLQQGTRHFNMSSEQFYGTAPIQGNELSDENQVVEASQASEAQAGEAPVSETPQEGSAEEAQVVEASQEGQSGEGQVAEAPQEGSVGEAQVSEASQEGQSGEEQVSETPQEGQTGEAQVSEAPQEGQSGEAQVTEAPQEGQAGEATSENIEGNNNSEEEKKEDVALGGADGNAMDNSEPAQETQVRKCHLCGEVLMDNAKFCNKCITPAQDMCNNLKDYLNEANRNKSAQTTGGLFSNIDSNESISSRKLFTPGEKYFGDRNDELNYEPEEKKGGYILAIIVAVIVIAFLLWFIFI